MLFVAFCSALHIHSHQIKYNYLLNSKMRYIHQEAAAEKKKLQGPKRNEFRLDEVLLGKCVDCAACEICPSRLRTAKGSAIC